MTERVRETLKILLGSAFAIFAVWGIEVGVPESLIGQLLDLLFALLGGIIGGPALIRAATKKKLVDK